MKSLKLQGKFNCFTLIAVAASVVAAFTPAISHAQDESDAIDAIMLMDMEISGAWEMYNTAVYELSQADEDESDAYYATWGLGLNSAQTIILNDLDQEAANYVSSGSIFLNATTGESSVTLLDDAEYYRSQAAVAYDNGAWAIAIGYAQQGYDAAADSYDLSASVRIGQVMWINDVTLQIWECYNDWN